MAATKIRLCQLSPTRWVCLQQGASNLVVLLTQFLLTRWYLAFHCVGVLCPCRTCCKAHDAGCADVDDLRPLLEEVVQHTYRQAQGQQQRRGLVEGQLEAKHIHNLSQAARNMMGRETDIGQAILRGKVRCQLLLLLDDCVS